MGVTFEETSATKGVLVVVATTIDAVNGALAEALKLKPEVNSLARMRAYNAWITNTENWTLQEETLNLGLRRAGLPDK